MVIYKTTNLVNGKFYIGKDKKNDPTYLGSGHILKFSIKKYGKENFKKEILEVCDSEEILNEREKFWIRELKCRERDDCYNIGEGGIGGDNISFNPNKSSFLEKMKSVTCGENNGMYGKNHTLESRIKLKEKAAGRFTEQWYINKYGVDEGLERYKKRNEKLKTDRLHNKNAAYIHVEKEVLIDYIVKNPNCKLFEMERDLGIGSTCLYNKFKLYFDCKNLKEVKNKMIC